MKMMRKTTEKDMEIALKREEKAKVESLNLV